MPYSVRSIQLDGIRANGAILVNHQGGPLFWPNVFVTSEYLCAGAAVSSAYKVLFTLATVYEWADSHALDFDEQVMEGEFLEMAHVEDLAYYLRLTRPSQREAVDKSCKALSSISHLEQVREGWKKNRSEQSFVSGVEAAARCRWVANFLEFLLDHRLGSMKRRQADVGELKTHGYRIIQRLRLLAPRVSQGAVDESLEGLPRDAIDLIEHAMRPGSDRNPFHDSFTQHRNYLIWRLLYETGMRRSELRWLEVANIDHGQHRVTITKSKTLRRTLPCSRSTVELFHDYIMNHWNKADPRNRAHGYLFTTRKGEHLSVDAINLVFREVRKKVPGIPSNLAPHALRRTWNDRFSEKIDAQPYSERMNPDQEREVRNRLMGWAGNSGMAEVYTRRHIRRKADEIGECLAGELYGADDE